MKTWRGRRKFRERPGSNPARPDEQYWSERDDDEKTGWDRPCHLVAGACRDGWAERAGTTGVLYSGGRHQVHARLARRAFSGWPPQSAGRHPGPHEAGDARGGVGRPSTEWLHAPVRRWLA